MASAGTVQLREITAEDLQDPRLSALNQILNSLNREVLRLGGFLGTITLNAALDLQGNSILNLGTPTDSTQQSTAAVSKTTADNNYGDKVVQKAIEVIGTSMPQTYRRLSDTQQREANSTFLNDTLSTPPTSNASNVSFTTIDASHTQINVSASLGSLADGSATPYASRSDIVTNPSSVNIAVAPTGAVRSGGIVTISTAPNPHGLIAGQFAQTVAITDGTFNTNFSVSLVIDANTFQFIQAGVDTTSGSGHVSTGGVYYYYLPADSQTLAVIGPFSSDTPTNRLQSNTDGRQFIAVAVVTASGGSPASSGGGGDPGSLGCVAEGTPVAFHPGDRCVYENVVPCSRWWDLELENGKTIRVSEGTLVSVFVRVEKLYDGMNVRVGHHGHWLKVKQTRLSTELGYKVMRTVEGSGTYLAGGDDDDGIELHNVKTA